MLGYQTILNGLMKAVVSFEYEPDLEELTRERFDKILADLERAGLVVRKFDDDGVERVHVTPRARQLGEAAFARMEREDASTH